MRPKATSLSQRSGRVRLLTERDSDNYHLTELSFMMALSSATKNLNQEITE
jgi:hypothetical protein